MCWLMLLPSKESPVVSVAGCLGYDVLEIEEWTDKHRLRFQLLVV